MGWMSLLFVNLNQTAFQKSFTMSDWMQKYLDDNQR